MYLYGSYDLRRNTTYCSYEYRVFSSSDLVEWTDHGDGIDPAVFIDDDGKAHYYWGQFSARGARLKPDMAA